MEATITGRTLVITSKITTDILKEAQKNGLETIVATNEEGKKEAIFSFSRGSSTGSLTKYGITFNGENNKKELQCTLMLNATDSEKRGEEVVRLYADGIASLAQNEMILIDNVNANTARLAEIMKGIKVTD